MGKLIDLVQIKGGKLLQQDVDTLKLSYEAQKVITDIKKAGGVENYNVNELLAYLKGTIDDQLGTGENSVDERLLLLRSELVHRINDAKSELQDQLDGINNTTIKDRVKIKGTVDAEQNILFASDIAEAVPAVLHQFGPYVVYNLNNEPLVDEFGENITLNFETMEFSGHPHEIDLGAKEELTYKPIEGTVDFKVFPVGEFTFATLPSDYLLDNNELNLITYSQAIDEIVFRLGKNSDLIDHVKSIVGQETVQQQIREITDLIQSKVDEIEAGLAEANQAIEELTDQLLVETEQLRYEIELLNAVKSMVNVFTPIENEETGLVQSVFELTHEPTEEPVRVFVNGVAYREDSDFVVDRANQLLTWTFNEAAGGFDLKADFELEVNYKFAEQVLAPGEEPEVEIPVEVAGEE